MKEQTEYDRFNEALKKVLQVSHTEMQKRLEQEKQQKQGRKKPAK